ncbi:adenosylcobinamide-phosphate synthase CbiB [Pseudobacteroides cellulosolvens]|uniref:Cobalamin biosynthesis protein CobD n=1 Tax=Pseudobacteroides cellulosolvens ATCC 35603 = DSM 2933 TaxID=398512 RepID=A0A0L6JQ78_9FIRM|nr:adenosylcobinamide-phosphate synthase CbiB [Pseudobacteroides cellulosolvens]KNY27996.1 Cobalamin biosynthesis protein cbiB [Pseudobacteroides cellulosolvens ATCC 35603 = DSM 2933]
MAIWLLLDIVAAFVLDLFFGDPHWLPHPVRFIGLLINKTEKGLRNYINRGTEGDSFASVTCTEDELRKSKRLAGIFLTIIVVGTTFFTVLIILKLAMLISPILFHIVNIYIIYSSIATKCLAVEAKKVYRELINNDIERARKSLAMLVGRDTQSLSRKETVRGVVETTAENTVDGVISPLFYAVLGSLFGLGAPLAYAFKAISTLDSMVGYMNEKYIDMGRFSAKADDAANYIPARISGLLLPLSAAICGMNGAQSFKIMLRDRRNHKSPNCAYPEAAVAGALGVMMGGNNVYFGKVVEKPTIGDAYRDFEALDIKRTIRLMYCSAILALKLFALIYTVVHCYLI